MSHSFTQEQAIRIAQGLTVRGRGNRGQPRRWFGWFLYELWFQLPEMKLIEAVSGVIKESKAGCAVDPGNRNNKGSGRGIRIWSPCSACCACTHVTEADVGN